MGDANTGAINGQNKLGGANHNSTGDGGGGVGHIGGNGGNSGGAICGRGGKSNFVGSLSPFEVWGDSSGSVGKN